MTYKAPVHDITAKIITKVVTYSTCQFICADCGEYVKAVFYVEGTEGKGWVLGHQPECPKCDAVHKIVTAAKEQDTNDL